MLNWLFKADRGLDFAIRWITMYFGVSAGVSWLNKNVSWFGQMTWPEAVYLGLAITLIAFLLIAFALAISAWGFRQFRPLPPQLISAEASAEQSDLKKIEERLSALEGIKKAIIDDYQRMSGLEVKTNGELDGIKLSTRSEFEKRDMHLAVLERKLGDLEKTVSVNDARDTTLALVADEEERRRFLQVYDALGAIYHRERLDKLGQELEDSSVELRAPTSRAATYDESEWELWEAVEGQWKFRLAEWCSLAENYAPGITDKVMKIDDAHYRQSGAAKVEQFPTPEAYIGYKGFCAIVKNWRDWRDEARRAVHAAAFNGGGRIPVAGGGDEEYLGGRS